MFQDVIISILMSMSSGYLTSEYILDMLFNKRVLFSKFNYGGIISDNKNEFIKSISSLLEKNIVNENSIYEKLTEENTDKLFEKFAYDFFTEHSLKNVRNMRLKDITVYKDFSLDIKEVFFELYHDNIDSMFEIISKNGRLEDLITDKQLDYISNKISQNLIVTLQHTDAIRAIISEIYDAFSNVKTSDIIPKSLMNKLKDIIESESYNFISIIKDNLDDEITLLCDEIMKNLKLYDIIDDISLEISKRPVSELIDLSTDDVRNSITQNIHSFVESPKGQKIFEDMYYEITDHLRNSDFSFLDICNNDYQDLLDKYILSKSDDIAYVISQWITGIRPQFKGIIKQTIDDVIIDEPALKSKITNAFIDYFSSSLSDSDAILKFILEIVNDLDNLPNISKHVTNELNLFFASTSAREIIGTLEDRRLISADIFVKSVSDFFQSKNKVVLNKIIDDIVSKPLKDILYLDVKKIFEDRIRYSFDDFIKENIFYNKSLHESIAREVCDSALKQFDKTKLSEVINYDYIIANIDKIKLSISKTASDNRQLISDAIKTELKSLISSGTIIGALKKLTESNQVLSVQNSEKLSNFFDMQISELSDKFGEITIDKLLCSIIADNDSLKQFSVFFKGLVSESISSISSGFIFETVEDYFNNLSDKDFVKGVKDISNMHTTKLHVANTLVGGTFGALVSVSSNHFLSSPIFSNTFSWQGILTCSLVGISSTFIATSGFSQLEISSKTIGKLPLLSKLPERYVRRKKQVMSEIFSDLIEENLFNKDTAIKLLQVRSNLISQNVVDMLKSENNKRISSLSNSLNSVFSRKISDYSNTALIDSIDIVAHSVSRNIRETSLKQVLNRTTMDGIADVFYDKKNFLIKEFFTLINNNSKDTNLLDCLSPDFLEEISDSIVLSIDSSFTNLTEFIKDTRALKLFFSRYEDAYISYIDKPLSDIFSNNTIESIAFEMFNGIYNNFFTEKRINHISKRAFDVIAKNFDVNSSLTKIMSARSKIILNGFVYKFFKDITSSIQATISDVRYDVIKTQIVSNLSNSLNSDEKLAFSSINGDRAIIEIIDRLTLNKLPTLFTEKIDLLYESSKNLSNSMLDTTLDDLQIHLSDSRLEDFLSVFFLDVQDKKSLVKSKCSFAFNYLVNDYKSAHLINFAKHFNLGSIKDILNHYDYYITNGLKQLYSNSKRSKTAIIRDSETTIQNITNYLSGTMLINQFATNLQKEDISFIYDAIAYIVEKEDLIHLSSNALINSFYLYLDELDMLGSFFNVRELNIGFQKLILNLTSNQKFKADFEKSILEALSDNLVEKLDASLKDNVKDFLTFVLIDGLQTTMQNNLGEIFEFVDFNEISKKQIMNISPKEFQEIFNVFVKKSKKRNFLIGLSGGLLGLNKFLTLGLVGLDTIKNALLKILPTRKSNDINTND